MFSDSEIRERFCDLFEIAQEFCADFNDGQTLNAEIDETLLYLTVVATYDDISRYKEYHLAEPEKQRSNSIKRAAYGVKWILNFCPIIFPAVGHASGSQPGAKYETLENAMFAFHFAMVNVQLECGKFFALNIQKTYELLYDMVYRNIGSDGYLLFFQLLSDTIADESTIEIY